MPLTISRPKADANIGPLLYRPGSAMACPACGERQWLVGRVVAECACCETVLPIELGFRAWNGIAVRADRLEPSTIA